MESEARRIAAAPLRAQTALEAISCGVVMLDSNGRVVEASTQAQDLLQMALPAGLDFETAIGDRFNLPEVLRPGDLARGIDLRLEDITLWLQSSPVAHGKAGLDCVVTVTDVSPYSKSIDERAMSLRFLLHDLRSPLNSISALTQLDAADPEAFERCGGMQQITQLAQYVLSLGEQFIFSSVSEHLSARDFKRFELRAAVRQIISQLEVTAVYCGVPLQLWLADNAPVWISGMRNFAARAIQNVIDNAVRASPRGESVTVTLRHDGSFVEVIVSDRAGGLPSLTGGERVTNFDRFSKKSATGFGLGLKLAVQIVELHGGVLYAELNTQGGTTFVLRFPCLNASTTRAVSGSLVDADRAMRAARG